MFLIDPETQLLLQNYRRRDARCQIRRNQIARRYRQSQPGWLVLLDALIVRVSEGSVRRHAQHMRGPDL